MFAERFELSKSKIEFRVFVGDVTKVFRRQFQLLKSSSGLGRDWRDNIEHSGEGFAKIRYSFASEDLAGIGPTGCLRSFGEVNCNLTQKSKGNHAGFGVAIKLSISIDLDIDPNLI